MGNRFAVVELLLDGVADGGDFAEALVDGFFSCGGRRGSSHCDEMRYQDLVSFGVALGFSFCDDWVW